MRRVTNTNILFWVKLTKALMEHFLQENFPLRCLTNAKPPFILYILTDISRQWSKRLDNIFHISNMCRPTILKRFFLEINTNDICRHSFSHLIIGSLVVSLDVSYHLFGLVYSIWHWDGTLWVWFIWLMIFSSLF